MRGLQFDLVRLSQRREQRLRLGNLGHFRCRRKALERRREDCVGVGGAGGRLVKLRKRHRRAQFEAARALLVGDGDGSQESLFRRCGVGGVAFQQEFAARPVQLGLECAVAHAIGSRQCIVEDGRGAAWVTGLGLGFRQGNFNETVKNQDVLRAQAVDATAHAVEAAEQVALDPRPPVEKPSEGAELGEIVGAGDSSKFEEICLRPHRAAKHQCKLRREHVPEGNCVAMCEGRYARQHPRHERRRAIRLSCRPQSKRKKRHC
jgi:hypothetical protein